MDENAKTRVSQSKPDPMVGRTIDGYRIEELLGRGGMGAVYRATQLSLGRSVALKVLTDELVDDAQFIERFHREADALSRLSHPNIVTVFERGEVDGRPYIVMEYVEGSSLRQLVREGALPAAEAFKIVSSVLSALQHAHDKGIVHRDIKPENVLMARGDVVKVADFGLSRLVDSTDQTRLTRTHLVLGTYEYMAPEQREHSKEADQRSDLYATGVVLYEMLTGELPIGRFDLPSAARPNECDARMDRIVERSLEKDPDRRYQEAGEMASAVSKVLEHPSARETPPPHGPAADRRDSGHVYRPARFEHHVDNLATIDQVLGTVSYILGFVSLMGFMRLPFSVFGGGVHFLVLFVMGWYLRDTGENLRKYRLSARTSQAVIAILSGFTGILLPFTIYSFLVLFGHRGRTYFEARNRGLSENESARHTFRVVESSFTSPPPVPPTQRPVAAPTPSQIPVQSMVTSEVAPPVESPSRVSPWIKIGIFFGLLTMVAAFGMAILEVPGLHDGGDVIWFGVAFSAGLLGVGLLRAITVKGEHGILLALCVLVLFGVVGKALVSYIQAESPRGSLFGNNVEAVVHHLARFRGMSNQSTEVATLDDAQRRWIEEVTGSGPVPLRVYRSSAFVTMSLDLDFARENPEMARRLHWATEAAVLRAHPSALKPVGGNARLDEDNEKLRVRYSVMPAPWDNDRERVWIATFKRGPQPGVPMPATEKLPISTYNRGWMRDMTDGSMTDAIELEVEGGLVFATIPKRLFAEDPAAAALAILAAQQLACRAARHRAPQSREFDAEEFVASERYSRVLAMISHALEPQPLKKTAANR